MIDDLCSADIWNEIRRSRVPKQCCACDYSLGMAMLEMYIYVAISNVELNAI